jgi:hypothetical protein
MARQIYPGWNQVLMAERRRFQLELCEENGKEISLKGWCNLKQKLTILAMVVLATIFIATPVLAVGSSRTMEVAKRTPTVISMTATIKTDYISRYTDVGSIYVAIQMTNRAFIQYRGESEWVRITSGTKCLQWVNKRKSIPMDCSDLNPEDRISVNARIDPESKVITARQVWLKQPRVQVP